MLAPAIDGVAAPIEAVNDHAQMVNPVALAQFLANQINNVSGSIEQMKSIIGNVQIERKHFSAADGIAMQELMAQFASGAAIVSKTISLGVHGIDTLMKMQ